MFPIAPFRLERYFGLHEFSAKHLLSSSDCETISVKQLVDGADEETRAAWETLKLGYTESQGLPQLRRDIAKMYEEAPCGQIKIAADQIVVGAPEELIFVAMSAMLTAGDHVVCLGPAYQSLHEVARAIGCELDMWNLRPVPGAADSSDVGTWGLDWDALSNLVRPSTKMLIVNIPHNPTGFLPTTAEQLRLVHFAESTNGGLLLFSDEMYRLLEHQDVSHRLPSTCTLYKKCITLSGMSKAFGLPGLRIGWLASAMDDVPFVHKILSLKDYTTICSSGPSEVLAWMGLRSQQRLISRNMEMVAANLAALESCCRRNPSQLRLLRPTAGSTALLEWISGGDDLEAFCAQALASRGLMIVPGSMFDASSFSSYFRVGLGRADFTEVLGVFEDILKGWRK